MIVIRGPDTQVTRIAVAIGEANRLYLRLRQEGAIEGRRQVRRGFAEGRDPYGARWAAVKRGGGPLRDTGRLSEFTVTLSANGFTLASGADYAATHQYGATIVPKRASALRFKVDGVWVTSKKVVVPKRQMVPEGTWGAIWEEAFTKRFDEVSLGWLRAAQAA